MAIFGAEHNPRILATLSPVRGIRLLVPVGLSAVLLPAVVEGTAIVPVPAAGELLGVVRYGGVVLEVKIADSAAVVDCEKEPFIGMQEMAVTGCGSTS